MREVLDKPFMQRLAMASALLIIVVLWAKNGLLPTASSGDDMWSADTAYAFLQEGTFRTPVLNDDSGRGVHELSPPPWILTQAVFIWLFGLNAYGMCAPAAFCSTLAMLGVWLLVRQLGGGHMMAWWAAVGIFGGFVIERGFCQGRPEPWNALALVFSVWAMLRGTKGMLIFAGVCLSIGGMAYLGQSPFFTLAWLAAFAALHGRNLSAWLWAGLGALPVSAAYFTWLGMHWEEFQRQVLAVGQDRYLSWSNMLLPFSTLMEGMGSQGWLQRVELMAACGLAGLVAWQSRRNRLVLAVSLAAFIASLPMFMITAPRQTAPSLLMFALLFAVALRLDADWMRKAAVATCVVLVLMGAVRMGMMGLTACVQSEGRDYARVTQLVRAAVKGEGPVATGKRSWLALREVMADDALDYLPYTWPSLPYTPTRAKREDADQIYRHVVIERNLVETCKQFYPWFKRGVETGSLRVTAEVRLPIRALPWEREPVFDLLVYSHVNIPNL